MPALIAYAHRVSDNRVQNFNRERYKRKAIVWELVTKYSAVMGIGPFNAIQVWSVATF